MKQNFYRNPKKYILFIFGGLCTLLIAYFSLFFATPNMTAKASNPVDDTKMLLVLSAPSIHDDYYKSVFEDIVAFQVNYVKAILPHDNVILLVDADTRKFYEGKVPKDVLLTANVHDIWMRDFTTVNPHAPMQFTYTWASMTKRESQEVQGSFSRFADKHGLKRGKTEYLLDGGNVVDNYKGKVIVTTRFLEDNYLEKDEGIKLLKQLTGANEVAIIEPDDDILAHSDGMVSFIDNNTLAVNDMSDNPTLKENLWKELKRAFPTTKLVGIPVDYKENPKGQFDDFASACGINLNAVMTNRALYVPTFNMAHEKEALDIISKNTTKKVVLIDAKNVCQMGGSVRCLTWQVTGDNAKKLIEAARK